MHVCVCACVRVGTRAYVRACVCMSMFVYQTRVCFFVCVYESFIVLKMVSWNSPFINRCNVEFEMLWANSIVQYSIN